MSHTSRTIRFGVGLAAGVLTLMVLPAAVFAIGDETDARDRVRVDRVDIGVERQGDIEADLGCTADRPTNWRRLLNEVETPPRTALEGAARECVFEQQYLPHTADAIEGWYRNCRAGH